MDCQALCGRVEILCIDRTDINDVWLDACRSACDARVRVAPSTAELEQRCVGEAATCNAAVTCVASPTG